MTALRRLTLAALAVAAAPAVAASTPPVPPLVRAAPLLPPRESVPGEAQPLAPGTRRAPQLPQLILTPPIPELQRLEYASNGFIEVAHGVVLLSAGEDLRARSLAAEVVRRALGARPQLSEVDVSVYDRVNYGGFGGPLPLLTASVPRARLNDFASWAGGGGAYERAWLNPALRLAAGPPAPPLQALERAPSFLGSAEDLLKQQVEQAVSQIHGGVRGALLFKGNSARPVAALSFDDAPHPLYEPLLLDLLRRENVKATFFVIGRNAVAYPYFLRDMVAQGHEIGNHTYHHVRLPRLSDAQVQGELTRANNVIGDITGQNVRFFRPPGGEYSSRTLAIAESLGLTTTFWTDDPGDFANPGDAVLRARLMRQLRPGGIVLLHDNAPEAIEVLPAFLRLARERGVRLTTVGNLADER